MSTMPALNHSITLEEISQRKTEVKKKIEIQKGIITDRTRTIFQPEPANSGINTYIQAFNRGIIIYDGVMTGIKIMRKIRKFFSKKR